MKKKMYKLCAVFIFLMGIFNATAQRKDARVLFVANLDGSQEVPAKPSKAKGLITVMLEENGALTINGVFDSLSGPATSSHFHTGGTTVAGAVIQDLSSGLKNGKSLNITIPNPAPSLIAGIMNSTVYLNVHTAANPGGEIRGVPVLETDSHYTAFLSGANEVPAVTTNGFGLLSMTVSKNSATMDVKAVVYGLSGAITASHFHYGVAGKTGPVIVPLTVTGNVITGTVSVTQPFLDSLNAGKIYMNVHTTANAGGEIRAQVTPVKAGAITFDALAEGANEAPTPVTSDAKALMLGALNSTLDTLTYAVIYSGLVPTAGHFHDGVKGVAGAVLQAFTRDTSFTNVYFGVFPLSVANRVKLIAGNLYINLHTPTNPGGEIRGQVNSTIREGLVAILCAGQEPTANTSTAVGAAAISVNRLKTDVAVNLVTSGLTGNATAAHIHKGLKGVNGAVYVGFTLNGNNTVNGVYALPTSGGGDSIINGQTYANVHTTANAGGEIRGQVGKTLEATCLTTGTFDLNGKQFTVTLAPNPAFDVVNVNFESNLNLTSQLTVTDLVGRTVVSKNVEILNGSNQVGLKVSDLAPGIYFIQLRNNNQLMFTEKFVKN